MGVLIKILLTAVMLVARTKARKLRMEPLHKPDKEPKMKRKDNGTLPESEDNLTWDEFQELHDEGNWTKKYKIFEISKKYFPDRTKNITKSLFVTMAREYIIQDLVAATFKLSFDTIAQLQKLFKKVLWHHFTDVRKTEMSFTDLYRYTIGGSLGRMLHHTVPFDELPLQLQAEIEKMHANKTDYELEEMFMMRRHKRRKESVELIELKKRELKRKFKEKYGHTEWRMDGRRVIDDDYDDLEPAFERKVHLTRLKKDKLTEDEIDELLEEDL
jgi:hypothetical protein